MIGFESDEAILRKSRERLCSNPKARRASLNPGKLLISVESERERASQSRMCAERWNTRRVMFWSIGKSRKSTGRCFGIA